MLAGSVCETQWRLECARKVEANILGERAVLIGAHAHAKYERALCNIQIQEARLQRTLFESLDKRHKEQATRRSAEARLLTRAINARIWH